MATGARFCAVMWAAIGPAPSPSAWPCRPRTWLNSPITGAKSKPQAPRWFVALLPLNVAPGVAKVSDGWKAAGEIELRGQTGYVHEALWRSTLSTASWLLLVAPKRCVKRRP